MGDGLNGAPPRIPVIAKNACGYYPGSCAPCIWMHGFLALAHRGNRTYSEAMPGESLS